MYIVGAQNSGSTMLDALFGGAESVHGLGEVGRIFQYTENTSCSCGRPAMSCNPCSSLKIDISKAGVESDLIEHFPQALGEKKLYKFLWLPKFGKKYAAVSDMIYESVFNSAAKEPIVLIDSSKNVSRAIALAKYSRYEIVFLHLVRDGRGYLKSRNSQARLERNNAKKMYFRNILKWVIKNLIVTAFLRPKADKYLKIRYEDFILDPDGVLDQISTFCEFDFTAVGSIENSTLSVERTQVFESPRRVDYTTVKVDKSRLQSQEYSFLKNVSYFLSGGFLGLLWGYTFKQDYLE